MVNKGGGDIKYGEASILGPEPLKMKHFGQLLLLFILRFAQLFLAFYPLLFLRSLLTQLHLALSQHLHKLSETLNRLS